MVVKTEGIIIRETPVSENDKFLTVLTPELGKISVYANGVRNIKSPYLNTSQLLCYNEFMLTEKKGKLWLKEIASIERFEPLRSDIELFTLTQYFMEVVNDVCMDEEPENDMYNLILNVLVLLCKNTIPVRQVKGIFELRTALYNGFMPELNSCGNCGKRFTHEMFYLPPEKKGTDEPGYLYFDLIDGNVRCRECFLRRQDFESKIKDEEYDPRRTTVLNTISEPVYLAVNYVFNAQPNRIHAFKLDETLLDEFSDICEKYLLNHLERGFNSLEFYKTLNDI